MTNFNSFIELPNPDADQIRTAYQDQWRLILRNVLGWPEDKVANFINRWDSPDPSYWHMISHFDPGEQVSTVFIPEELHQKLNASDLRKLGLDIAFSGLRDSRNSPHFEIAQSSDWNQIRRQIDEIISRYRRKSLLE